MDRQNVSLSQDLTICADDRVSFVIESCRGRGQTGEDRDSRISHCADRVSPRACDHRRRRGADNQRGQDEQYTRPRRRCRSGRHHPTPRPNAFRSTQRKPCSLNQLEKRLIKQWDKVFESIANRHPDTDCGVFFCGPPVLGKTLHQMSNKYTSPAGCRFFFGKEVRRYFPSSPGD